MKTALLTAALFTSCGTPFTVAYQTKDGQRFEASAILPQPKGLAK